MSNMAEDLGRKLQMDIKRQIKGYYDLCTATPEISFSEMITHALAALTTELCAVAHALAATVGPDPVLFREDLKKTICGSIDEILRDI